MGKKRENKAIGLTKGGLNTKIHAIVDGLGNPVAFLLSPGNDGDSTHAIELMNRTDITGSNLLADKAYGTKAILAYIKDHGATVVIHPEHPVQHRPVIFPGASFLPRVFRREQRLNSLPLFFCNFVAVILIHTFMIPHAFYLCNFYFSNKA